MGRYIEQTDSRSELQQRIAADLRAKAVARSKDEGGLADTNSAPDGIDDSHYIEGTKRTTSLAWAWLLIFIFTIIAFVVFVVQANR